VTRLVWGRINRYWLISVQLHEQQMETHLTNSCPSATYMTLAVLCFFFMHIPWQY